MTAPLDLTLALAEQIIAAALQKGKDMALKPLTVAVLDRGGHLIALVRQDGSSLLRPQIAMGKASSALALGVSSRTITTMAAERPSFIAALGPIAQQGLCGSHVAALQGAARRRCTAQVAPHGGRQIATEIHG